MTAYFLGFYRGSYCTPQRSTGETMSQILKGQRPDITPAQIIAVLFGAAAPIATLVGVDLSAVQLDAIDQLKWLGLGLFGADATIRLGRNMKDAKVEAAALAAPAPATPSVSPTTSGERSSSPFTPQEIEELDPSDPEVDAADADVTKDEEDGMAVG